MPDLDAIEIVPEQNSARAAETMAKIGLTNFHRETLMATLLPFKGIFYNPDKIRKPSVVVAPPYDVISPSEQQAAHQRHPNNVIRLILGQSSPQDDDHDNPHTRAAAYYRQWLSERILVADRKPALYWTATEFDHEGGRMSRHGLIARVGLEPFEKGIILPHEETFSKVKSERLELMQACHANFSPIFALYSDRRRRIAQAVGQSIGADRPDIDFTDIDGQRHKLWRIVDPQMHRHVQDIMQEKNLFIADGHHRYETALNYRQWLRQNRATPGGGHPSDCVMMYLSSLQDTGLIIQPAHRLLKGLDADRLEGFIRRCDPYFEVAAIAAAGQAAKALDALKRALSDAGERKVFGAFVQNRSEYYVLTLKPDIMSQMFGTELPSAIRRLDVTVLTRLLFCEILAFDESSLDNDDLIGYSSDTQAALDAVSAGHYQMAFILNPTRIEQVQQIAARGLIMPRKSTYFYPKVISGLVLNGLQTERPGLQPEVAETVDAA